MEQKRNATHRKWLLSGLTIYSIAALIALLIIIGCIATYLYAVTHGWNFTIKEMDVVKQGNNASLSISYNNPNRFSIIFNVTRISFTTEDGIDIWMYNKTIGFEVPEEVDGHREISIMEPDATILFNYINQTIIAHVVGEVTGTTCRAHFEQIVSVKVIGGV